MAPKRIVSWIAFAVTAACLLTHRWLFPGVDGLSAFLLMTAGVTFGMGCELRREDSRP